MDSRKFFPGLLVTLVCFSFIFLPDLLQSQTRTKTSTQTGGVEPRKVEVYKAPTRAIKTEKVRIIKKEEEKGRRATIQTIQPIKPKVNPMMLAPVKQLPDLMVEDISLDKECRIGITLKNIGKGEMPLAGYDSRKGVVIQVYKGGQQWGALPLKIFDRQGRLKKPGSLMKQTWYPQTEKFHLEPGRHPIRVVLDRKNTVTEVSESNNTRTAILNCRKKPERFELKKGDKNLGYSAKGKTVLPSDRLLKNGIKISQKRSRSITNGVELKKLNKIDGPVGELVPYGGGGISFYSPSPDVTWYREKQYEVSWAQVGEVDMPLAVRLVNTSLVDVGDVCSPQPSDTSCLWAIPTSIPIGSYRLAYTDLDGTRGLSQVFKIAKLADLSITSMELLPSNHPSVGDVVTFVAHVKDGFTYNHPPEEYNVEIEVRGPGGVVHHQKKIPVTLLGPATQNVTMTYKVSTYGIYRNIVRVDVDSDCQESDETNNEDYFIYGVNPKPDLQVFIPYISNVKTGRHRTVDVYVKNIGEMKSHPVPLTLLITSKGQTTHTVPALDPMETWSISRREKYRIKDDIYILIEAIVDPEDALDESDEMNNGDGISLVRYPLVGQPRPPQGTIYDPNFKRSVDMAVSYIVPAATLVNERVPVLVKVTNVTESEIAPASRLNLEMQGYPTRSVDVPSLFPGEEHDIIFNAEWSDVGPKSFNAEILVVSDEVEDTNYVNNIRYGMVSVSSGFASISGEAYMIQE